MNKVLLLSLLVLAGSCSAIREAREYTFSQKCAAAFPPKIDTVIVEHWEVVNFPLTEYDTVVLSSIPCPPGLTDTLWITNEVKVLIPGRIIQVPVGRVETTIHKSDEALKQAYDDLINQYEILLADCLLQDARVKSLSKDLQLSKAKWPIWVWIAIGSALGFIIVLVASRVLGGKKN